MCPYVTTAESCVLRLQQMQTSPTDIAAIHAQAGMQEARKHTYSGIKGASRKLDCIPERLRIGGSRAHMEGDSFHDNSQILCSLQ